MTHKTRSLLPRLKLQEVDLVRSIFAETRLARLDNALCKDIENEFNRAA